MRIANASNVHLHASVNMPNVSHVMYSNISRGVHSRGRLFHSEPSKVRRSFEGGVHSRAVFNRINTVYLIIPQNHLQASQFRMQEVEQTHIIHIE